MSTLTWHSSTRLAEYRRRTSGTPHMDSPLNFGRTYRVVWMRLLGMYWDEYGLQRDIQTWLAGRRYQDKARLSNLPHTLGISPKFDLTRLLFLLGRLEEGCSWDDGLERAVEIQYDLQQQRAWFLWVQGCVAETRSCTELRQNIRLPANDHYVGFWVNGRSEENHDAPNELRSTDLRFQNSTTFNEYFFLHASSEVIGPSTPSDGIPPVTWPYPAFSLHGQRGNTSPSRALNPNAAHATLTPSTLQFPASTLIISYLHDDPEPIPTSEGRAVTSEPLIDAVPGKWTHWMEMDDLEVDSATVFASTSKTTVELDGQRVVYDRQNRRQILLDDFTYPAGTIDPDLYGFRLPERGKQAVREPSPPRSTSPSEVSLGSPEREEPEPKVFPTQCLRVDHLDLSSVNLAALARNDESLEHAGVFLKEIIAGQGATWMCFNDDESPGLIWDWLECLHPNVWNVRVEVTSREAFNDASQYSHDRWDRSFVDSAPAPRKGLQEQVAEELSRVPVRRDSQELLALLRAPQGPESARDIHQGDTDDLVASPPDVDPSDQGLPADPDRPDAGIKARDVNIAGAQVGLKGRGWRAQTRELPPPETIKRRWGLPAGTLRTTPDSPKTCPDGLPSRAVLLATIER
ncbi:hypothetical protein C8F01DRAFT_1084892 [Mycena amicta]|nr:hypothetical protein C8F01DRAFT_1084892 [Mycena amicta]